MRATPTLVRLVLHLVYPAAATVACAACAGGCTTAAVVSAGTVAGLAASAVSTGADVYQMGKLDSADKARFRHWIGSVRTAAAELRLKVQKESDNGKGEWRCTLVDDQESKVSVIVERRTETLCRTRIDVGLFGSEPTARLLLARVRVHEDPTSAGATATLTTTTATTTATTLETTTKTTTTSESKER